MSTRNEVRFIGRLGGEPELRYAPSGTAVVNPSLAVTDRRPNQEGEWEEVTTWVRITLFGARAESFSDVVGKGDLVAVQGRYQTGTWEDEDGNTRYNHDFIIDNWDLLSQAEANRRERSQTPEPEASVQEDQIPF